MEELSAATCGNAFSPNKLMVNITSNIVRIIMTTVVTFEDLCSPTYTQTATSAARIIDIIGKDTPKFNPINACVPCAFSTATHAISCITFNAAKNLEP